MRGNNVLLLPFLNAVQQDTHEFDLISRRESRLRLVEQIETVQLEAVTPEKRQK